MRADRLGHWARAHQRQGLSGKKTLLFLEEDAVLTTIDVGLAGYLVEPDGALDGGAGEGGEVQGGGVHQVETEPRRLPNRHS